MLLYGTTAPLIVTYWCMLIEISNDTSSYLIIYNNNVFAIKWNHLIRVRIYLDTFYKDSLLLYLPSAIIIKATLKIIGAQNITI